jgi:tetratricopeptide (TPR) repeat protein
MIFGKKGQVFRPVPFFILLFLPFSALNAESILTHPGEDRFQRGVAALQEGDLDEAEEHFGEALLLEPMNPDYRFELGNLYAMRYQESYGMGDDLDAQNRLEAAARELEQAVMIKPDFLAAKFNLGVVYKNLGEYEKARQKFKEVLNQDPAQGPAMVQIGMTYEEQGFYDEAETIYKDLLERFPNHPALQDALNGLAQRRYQARMREASQAQTRQMALNTGLAALAQGRQQQQSSNS